MYPEARVFLFTSGFQSTGYKCYDKIFVLDIFIFFSYDQVFHRLSLANQGALRLGQISGFPSILETAD